MDSTPPVVPRQAPDVVELVLAALRAGGAVVLPTDTVYGLAALPGDRAATDRVFALKGRAARVPLAVLCASAGQALDLAAPTVDDAVHAVAERWWPGPLTLVVPRRAGVGLHLGEPATTIGLRVPDDDLVRQLAAAVGPIAATSANRHGSPTPATATEALASLGPGVALVVDGGRLKATASTVIDTTERPWRALREGTIPAAEILEAAEGASAAQSELTGERAAVPTAGEGSGFADPERR